MKKILRRILQFFITGSFSLFLAACYGMPAGFGQSFSARITALDGDNNPIPDLEVTLTELGQAEPIFTTDTTGTAYIDVYATEELLYTARIQDVDGVENGGLFAEQTFQIYNGDDVDVTMQEVVE